MSSKKKLVYHSNVPWAPSGYGRQTALFAPRIAALGYDVILSSFGGLTGTPLTWEGLTVMPAGQDAYGSDIIPAHAHHTGADLVLTLLDVWALQGQAVKGVPMACWTPVDVGKRDPEGGPKSVPGLGDGDRRFFDDSGAIPIAMSEWGRKSFQSVGFDPLYVPHGVDTSVFTPRQDRDELREKAGLDGKFVVGIVAANKDAIRKCFFEQFEAFGRFQREHCPEAVLMVHTLITNPGAADLRAMAAECGITDSIRFSHQYKTLMGFIKPSDIAEWLCTADVLLNTALGEGFGLTPLEALACGVPTIVNDCSAMTELSLGEDWRVSNQPFWNPTHNARWAVPLITDIVSSLCYAYQRLSIASDAEVIRKMAREKALGYDVNTVTESYWRPALIEALERVSSS